MQEFPDATSPSTTTSVPLEQAASAPGLSTGRIVALIVAGFLGVASVLSLLTVRYWRATRPGGGPPV
ncbi:MAG: hypothetical protein ACR2K0_09820 [Acidimicrobiales bacterium]